MSKLLVTVSFLFLLLQAVAQVSDIISVRKKNGSILRTFFAGSPILFQTKDKAYIEGTIQYMRNDSIFLTVYDIRSALTHLGVTMSDTITRYTVGVHYKDILRIKVFRYRRFVRGKVDKLLMFGGAGYFGLNIVNGAYFSRPITEKQNLQALGISAGAFGAGWLIKRFFPVNRFSRKRHKIIYVSMTPHV